MSNGRSTATSGAVKPEGSDILGLKKIDPYTALLAGERLPNQDEASYRDQPMRASETRYGSTPKAYERILGDGNYHPEFGPEYNASLLAIEQSGMRQFGSMLNQAIIGEVVGGTFEGTGYLLDLAQYGELASGTEQEFGNALSDVGKAIREWTQEATPIYMSSEQNKFAPNRWSWWMSNAPSILSTISLLIPATGVVKGISAMGKAAKIGFGGKAFLKSVDNIAAKYGEKVAANFARGSEAFATGVGQATVSRHMENLMEASSVYEEVIQSGGTQKEAALAATNTYNKQWLLMVQDIPQYLLFNKLRGGKGAAEKSKDIASFLGYDTNKYFINKPVSVLKTMIGEGFEEGFQYVINEQSKLMAETAHDPAIKHSFGKVLSQNIDDGELYTSMFFGALGAGAMLGTGHLTQRKKMAESNEARIKDLKDNGKRLNAAYQAYSEARASGDPIKEEVAESNLSMEIGISAVLHDNVENAIETIDQLAKGDNTALAEKLQLSELAAGELQQNPEKAERIIKDIKRIEDLYDRFKREVKKNDQISEKQKLTAAMLLTENQFKQEKAQEQISKSEQRLSELEGQMQGLEKLTSVGRQVAILQSRLDALNGHTYIDENNNPVSVPGILKYYEDRLANKKKKGEKRQALGKEEKLRLEAAVAQLKLNRDRVERQIKELQADPAYTKAMKTNDTKTRKTLDDRLVNAYIREQRRNQVNQVALQELEEDAEKYRSAYDLSSPKEKAEAESTKAADRFDPDTDIAIDDLVGFRDDNDNPIVGFVDDIELATEDTEGNAVEPSGDNGNNTYTLNLVDEDGNLTGEQTRVTGDLLEILDKRQYFEEEFTTSDLTEEEDVRTGQYNIREANKTEQNGAPTPIDNVSYSHQNETHARVIDVRNPALNRKISNPKTDLSKARASYELDSTHEWNIAYMKGENDAGKELYKNLSPKEKVILKKLANGGVLTSSEINSLLVTRTGSAFADFIDRVRIKVRIDIGKDSYSSGLVLHDSSFPYISVPANIRAQEKTKPGSIAKYKREKMFEARKIRTFILKSILEGRTPYTKGLSVGRGHPNSKPGTTNNVASTLKQNANDVVLGITQPKIENPYDAKLLTGAVDSNIPAKNYSSAGSIYAITDQTVNGEPYALKLNKRHISSEHAAIIYEAFRLIGLATVDSRNRAKTPKEARRNVQFKKDDSNIVVKGLSTGELLDILVVHGKELSDPDVSKRNYTKQHYQILANKRLYLDFDHRQKTAYLVYGHDVLTNQPYRIDLRKASVSQMNSFHKWITENKTYAAHLNKRVLSQELNGEFLKGRGFTIGKKDIIKREKGDNYTGFLLKNNLVTTDATRNKEGQLFHAPTLSLGLKLEKDDQGEDVLPFKTGAPKTISVKKKPVIKKAVSKTNVKPDIPSGIETKKAKNIISAGFESQATQFMIEIQGENKPFLLLWDRNNANPTLWGKKQEDGSYTTTDAFPSKQDVQKLVDKYVPKSLLNLLNKWTEASKLPAKEVLDAQELIEKEINAELKALKKTRSTTPKKTNPATKEVKSEDIQVEDTKEKSAAEKKAEARRKKEKAKPVKKRTDPKSKKVDEKIEESIQFEETKNERKLDPDITMPAGMPEPNFEDLEGAPSLDNIDETGVPSLDNLDDIDVPSLEIGSVEDISVEDGVDAARELLKKKRKGRARPYKKTPFKRQNLEKESRWVNKKVNIPLSEIQLKKLGELVRLGQKNFALFTRDGILLYEAAEEGTLYHESFHRVSLGYLSENERKAIYRLARQYYKMPKASDRDIEEALAEGFREYVINKEENKDTSVIGQIKKFFSELYDFIRALFIKKSKQHLNVTDIETLFKEIHRGRFRFSKITEENYKKLEFDEYAKMIGNREFHTIPDRQVAHDMTKFLMDELIESNEVVKYGDVVNLKWEPVIELIETIVQIYDELSKSKTHDAAAREDASRVKMMYEEVLADIQVHGVNGNRSEFVSKVNSYLNSIGIVEKYNKDFDATDDLNEEEEVVGKVDIDKKMSYQTSSKEKARAKIKFMIATLHESSSKHPITKTQSYVDFDSTWHLLYHYLHQYDTIEEMLDELDYLGGTIQGGYKYMELAEKLREDTEETRTQFLTTFRMHRHEYLNFIFRQSSTEGTAINVTNTAMKQAYDSLVKRWNQGFFLDPDVIHTNEKGEKFIREDFMDTVIADFEDLVSKVDVAVQDQDYREELAGEAKQDLLDLLDLYHINIDVDTVNYLLDNRGGKHEIERMDSVLSSLRNLFVGKSFAGAARDQIRITSPDQLFFTDPIVREIGEAHARTHPQEIPDVVIGAGNNRYFTYSSNNMLTDINRRIYRERGVYVEEKSSLIGNRGSMIFEQMQDEGFDFDNFGLVTFSNLKEKDSRDTGRDYTSITRLEDYLVRFSAIENGYLTMPILADRKQYYLIKGLKLYKDSVVNIERDEDGNRSYNWSNEVVDRFYKYYLDEKDRIQEATKLRDRYKAAETAEERENIEMEMIENYHYTGDFDVDSTGANAYRFIHFKGFPKKGSATSIKKKIRTLLDAKLEEELAYASSIDIIYDVDGLLSKKTINKNSFVDKSADLENEGAENTESDAIRHVFGDFLVNTMVGVFESEKVFFGDPAFFKKNKLSSDVNEDMYKRWFGAGSTGVNISEHTRAHPNSTYSVVTAKTQTFTSKFLPALIEKQTALYEEYLRGKEENRDLTAEQLREKATSLAKNALSAYEEVDPTDGQMFISPEMYRSIADRLGEWDTEKENAFQLLQSERDLTPEEELSALSVVLQPLKTVYIGKETRGNLDVVIYDKMSMATIFRRQVKDTHLEDILDRMEGREERGGPTGVLPVIDAIKFDTVTKIGGRNGIELFKDGATRTELNDLTDVPLFHQKFENLKYQVETDVHDVETQTVGTQMFKIAMMNIDKKATYGKFGTGVDLTTKITNSRVALSDIGVEEVRAKFGVENGIIKDESFIKLRRSAAEKAGKSDDFIRAHRLDENNKAYLQLDSFPDRNWGYSRIISIINSHTVDLNMPGNQLIQVSDYGHSGVGLNKKYDLGNIKQLKKDLSFITLSENGTKVNEMEARVSISLIKKHIPNYDDLSWKQKEDFVKNKLNIIGYRIPTQGQNSIVRLKIVELLREQGGDIIQLPLEFTALTGSDFDIDKLYVMSYNYYTDQNGELKKHGYIEGNDEKSVSRRYFLKTNEYKRINDGDIGTLPSKEEFAKWSIEKQNTKEANQNRILDAFYTILGHESHFLETTTPLGRSAGVLKDMATDLEKAELGGKTRELTALETGTPKFQSATKFRFTGASGGIGPFALANAHHSLTQQAELGMNTNLDFGWNDTTLQLDRVRGNDGVLISDWLSALIDAHVDAAKDPYIIQLNVNESTYDVLNFLLRIGVGKDSFHFLSQPILKEFSEEFFNANGKITAFSERNTKARKAAYHLIKNRWLESLGYEGVETDGPLPEDIASIPLQEVFNEKTLLHDTNAKNHNTTEFKERQLNILEHFMEIASESDNLTQLVMVSRVDTKKFGTTPTEWRHFLNNIMTMEAANLSGSQGAISKWVNLDRLLQSSGEYTEGSTMLSPLLQNSLKLSLELMRSESIYASSGFSEIFWQMLNSTPNGRVASKRTVKDITEEIYSYFAGQFFADKVDGLGIDAKYVKTLFSGNKNTFFHTLDRIKRNAHPLSEELMDNKFIRSLSLDYNEDTPLKTYIRLPFKSLQNKWEMDDYIDALNDLFAHSNPEVKKLAKDIYVASFYLSGFRNRLNSFHSYIPLEVIKSFDVDGKKVSFNEYIKNLLTELNSGDFSDTHVTNAKQEIFLNNWFNKQLVPTVSSHAIETTYWHNKAEGKAGGYKFRSGKDGEFGLQSKYYLGTNNQKEFIYVPYVLLQMDDGSTQLLQYTGLLQGDPIYRLINKKGFISGGTVLREYGLTGLKSVADPNTTVEAEAEMERLEEEGEGRTIFNNPYALSEEVFVKAMRGKGNFNYIPLVDQIVEESSVVQNAFEDARGGVEKRVRVEFRPENKEKILSGEKTTTVRSAAQTSKIGLMGGETGIFEIEGQSFEIKLRNSKPLTIKEAGGLEKMLASEGVNSVDEFAYNQTKTWAEGKTRLFVYDITRRNTSDTKTKITVNDVDFYVNPRYKGLKRIISGGQTGIDKLGLVISKLFGFITGGTATPGFKVEKGKVDTSLATEYGLKEVTPEVQATVKTTKEFYIPRTRENVKNSDGTVYFADNVEKSRGIHATKNATDEFNKPFLLNPTAKDLAKWMAANSISTLNVAGSRESGMTAKKKAEFESILKEAFTLMQDLNKEISLRTKPDTTRAGDAGRVTTENTNINVEALSSPNKRISVFADGSVIWKDKVAENYGYGAYMTFMGGEYQLSGNKEAVDKYMSDFTEEGTTAKMSSVVVELLATLESLKAFENTGEHITIFQDGDSAVNYGRVLWERSAGSESRQRSGPKNIKQPHIQKIVSEIERLILNIERGGGSVRIKWIPTNKGAYDKTAARYPGTFIDAKGAPSNKLVRFYGAGNSRADALARDTKNRNTFSALRAPKVGEVRTTIKPTAEELENGVNKKNEC